MSITSGVPRTGGTCSGPGLTSASPKSSVKESSHAMRSRASDAPSYSCNAVPMQTGGLGSSSVSKRSRFTPQLIETTKRSRKSGDSEPALLHTDRTDLSPGDQIHLPRNTRLAPLSPSLTAPTNSPVNSSEVVSQPLESRYSSTNLKRRAPRRHSFKVPDLEPIRSTAENEGHSASDCPSISNSPSAFSEDPEHQEHATRVRESCDDRYSGYLLALAARAAEKQLREQAMAAYPNEAFHQPVDHFAIDRESDTSEDDVDVHDEIPSQQFRRASAAGLELAEMQKHQERLEMQRIEPDLKEHSRLDENSSSLILQGVNMEKHKAGRLDGSSPPVKIIGGWQKGVGLEHMRSAARAPMLGDDLAFPKSLSPRQTRLDVDQYPTVQRTSGATSPEMHSGLWTPNNGPSRRGSVTGLWHGVNAASENQSLLAPCISQSGLMTPRVELDDPFSNLSLQPQPMLPPSPATSQEDTKRVGIDDLLSLQQILERDFHDGFVTQVYNYLSLGYPSLARKFDPELSKISKLSLVEIRKQDDRKVSKGYLYAGQQDSDVGDATNEPCGRWVALRMYINEWARQQPRMHDRKAGANDDWGARARRGSWAI